MDGAANDGRDDEPSLHGQESDGSDEKDVDPPPEDSDAESNSPYTSSDEEEGFSFANARKKQPVGLWYTASRDLELLAARDCLVCMGSSGLVREGERIFPSIRHWFCDVDTLLGIDRAAAIKELNSLHIPSICTPHSTASVSISQETDSEIIQLLADKLKENICLVDEENIDDFKFREMPLQRIHFDLARFKFTEKVFYGYYGLNCINSRSDRPTQDVVPKDDPYIEACRSIYMALFGDPLKLEQQAYTVVEAACELQEDLVLDVAPGTIKKLRSTLWYGEDFLAHDLDSDATFMVINRDLNVACAFYCYMSRVYG